MSVSINIEDIQSAYERGMDCKDTFEALSTFLDGYEAYGVGTEYEKKGALLNIYTGLFGICEIFIPEECGGWTIGIASDVLESFKKSNALRKGIHRNILNELSLEAANNLDLINVQHRWESMTQKEVEDTVDRLLGIAEDVEESAYDNGNIFDWYRLGLKIIFGKNVSEKAKSAKCDPLVIDVYGSGFDTISVDDGVYFDLDNEGLTEKTGWVNGAVNGFLAHDLDEDGIISDGTELFTDQTMLSDGLIAESGFAALADLDMNGDGVISAEDEAFSELSIWQDINGNGYTDEGELKSLAEHGITSISLSASSDGTVLESGAVLEKTAAVSFTDGTVTDIGQFSFESLKYDTTEEPFDCPDEISSLPNVTNIGNIHSLHYLMTFDPSGTIQSLIADYTNANNEYDKRTLIENLLYTIAGNDTDDIPTGWNELIDVRKLSVAANATGTVCDGYISTHAAETFTEIFDSLVSVYYAEMNIQTSLSEFVPYFHPLYVDRDGLYSALETKLLDEANDYLLGEMASYMKTVNNNYMSKVLRDLYCHFALISDKYAQLIVNATNGAIATNNSDSIIGSDNADLIFGGAGNDYLVGGYGNDSISGGDGDDLIYGISGKNALLGSAGNDTILGGSESDTISGGAGDDTLDGQGGNDTYMFGFGDGTDHITDIDGINQIVIGLGLSRNELSVSYENENLVFTFTNSDDKLIIDSFTRHPMFRNFVIYFEENEALLDCSDITQDIFKTVRGTTGDDYMYSFFGSSVTLMGLDGNDSLNGSLENDVLYGGDGDDSFYGNDGDDTLNGGAGTDSLCGGNGMDTYIFAKGYGIDTINEWGSDHSIIQLTDINSDEVTITDQWGSNLVLSVNGTEDSLIVSNFKWGQASFTFEFADGAIATVNKDTWALEFSQLPAPPAQGRPEALICSNAELLCDLYEDGGISSDMLDSDNSDVMLGNAAPVNEASCVSDQTDLQVMLLTENMSAFGAESNISINMNITDITDTSVMNQLLVGTQVQ